MPVRLVIIEICFLFLTSAHASQINSCLSAASMSVAKWSKEHDGSGDRVGTMKFLKCLHYCLVHGKSIGSMSEQLTNCFQTQTLMMNLWNEFLSRDDPVRCFKRVSGKVLIGLVDQLNGDIASIEECEQKCQQHKKCLSAAYYQKEKECIITSETKETAKDLYVDDSNSIYTENLCANEKPISGPNESTNTDKAPTDNEITTTEKPRTTQATALSAEMIDNYGMVPKQRDPEIHFQFRDQVLNRDECFSEFYPPNIKTAQVERAESLKDCVNKCRECRKCLNGRRCSIAGYSVERQFCALAPKQQLQELERSNSMGNFIFMRRGLCKN